MFFLQRQSVTFWPFFLVQTTIDHVDRGLQFCHTPGWDFPWPCEFPGCLPDAPQLALLHCCIVWF